MKLVVFLPNWIGDVVMATPTLRALRRHYGPQARIIGVMRPYVAQVLEGTRWLDQHLYYDPHSRDACLRGRNLVGQLRTMRPDQVVLLTNSLRTGLFAWLSGARRRVGYARYGRGPLLTDRLTPPQENGRLIRHPMVDYYLELAYAAGCAEESHRLELATTPADEQAVQLVWQRLGLRADRPVVVFNSSGAFGAAKLWPPEHFAALARRVVGELDHDVLVICGPSEREIAAEVVRRAQHPRVVSLAQENLSIGLSKMCIRRSRLLVTTDSGPRHFAVAFNVPLVGLYGPTPPIWGQNRTAQSLDLHLELDCFGCHQRVCPLAHHRCMRDLSVDRVMAAIRQQLGLEHRWQAA